MAAHTVRVGIVNAIQFNCEGRGGIWTKIQKHTAKCFDEKRGLGHDKRVKIRYLLSFLFISVVLLCSSHVFANGPLSQSGGVFLEFPQGRFQENAAPSFFKWNLQTKTDSVALKVFRCAGTCGADTNKDLVVRFDFLSNVQSMNWFGDALPVGNYVWTVEAFNKNSSNPVFSDTATFSIEPVMTYGFKTERLGLMAGFGRGDYGSVDDNYEVKFRTTPTTYGLSYGGGSQSKIWNAKAYISDFVLKGQIYQTTTVSTEYLWQLNVSNPQRLLFFLGPSLKFFNYPQVISTNGTDLNIKDKWVLLPGISLKSEYALDKYIAAQMGFSYAVAALGSETLDMQFENGSWNASLGLSYGKIWPVGIASEIQYQSDCISTKQEGNGLLDVKQTQWIFLLHLFYAI